MKKIFKTTLSVILTFIMTFGSLTAFAAEKGDELIWEYYEDWTETYYYDGEITEGTKTFSRETHESHQKYYYDFNVEKTGFYAFSFSRDEGYIIIPQKLENGKAYNFFTSYYIYNHDNEIPTVICNLDAGETIVGIQIYSLYCDLELSVEYLGEKAEELVFTENSNKDLIIGSDIEYWSDFETDESFAGFKGCANLIFSSGKSVELRDQWFYFECDEEIKKGENNVEIEVMGQHFSSVITCATIDDYVKDVRLKEEETYLTVKENINGYIYPEIIESPVMITFTDGTSVEIEGSASEDSYVILPNGREYYVSWYYIENFDGVNLIITIGGQTITEYECNIEIVPLSENVSLLIDESRQGLKDSAYNFRMIFSTLLDYYDYEDFINSLYEARNYFGYAIVDYANIWVRFLRLLYFVFAF